MVFNANAVFACLDSVDRINAPHYHHYIKALQVRHRVKPLSVRDFFFVVAGMFSSSLLVSQALSVSQPLSSSKISQGVPEASTQNIEVRDPARDGFRPVPANRMISAKGSIDEQRNPFAVDSPFTSQGSIGSISSIASGLNSLRLTGIVQEGSSLKALVEDGSEHASLALGDPLSLGVFQGLGFRVTAISFAKGNISISNGREERQISVQR